MYVEEHYDDSYKVIVLAQKLASIPPITISDRIEAQAQVEAPEWSQMFPDIPSHESDNWLAWYSFLSRPGFSRVWVLQEVTLTRDAVVQCGDGVVQRSHILGSVRTVYEQGINAFQPPSSQNLTNPTQ